MCCDRCGDELPPEARFCIDCGASLTMTEATIRLGEAVCSDCYASNPEDAWNCSSCGRRFAIDITPPYQPAPVYHNRSANRAAATDLAWVGDLLLFVFELLACL
jgi:ribosomal protein L40E